MEFAYVINGGIDARKNKNLTAAYAHDYCEEDWSCCLPAGEADLRNRRFPHGNIEKRDANFREGTDFAMVIDNF